MYLKAYNIYNRYNINNSKTKYNGSNNCPS
jgi:hypothetical protein